ncbi:hypothetical protein I316_03412 [Kwoniella heveanensis BCC8398]|uniref:WSC domain-containing protein n=1 Tax=Kwoniella heveanensis BCC8398 TaxID=1296120 RepID=A0A1B9GV08_9TREE|nr:hypothetical protein I316_03412 [Kwoniella heveanensis BCC8398]
MFFQTLFSLLPALAALPAANAYFILSHPVLETTRLDPIVNPGGIGAHVHSVVGGNNFDKSMTYESTQASTCTTASVTADKSNYWTPQLYYYNPTDESYQAIPVAYVNTYYLPRYSPGETTVQAFPDGLRMVSGDPNRRTYDGDADSNAVTYVCLDYSGSHSGDPEWAERNSFFNHNCPSGMRAQIFFRSCWDGVNLDSDDHMSHMAWPSGGVNGGSCPSTHPVRLVSLFYEFIYQVQNFPYNNGSVPTWVYANGDTTGYGMHGDFLNGWPSLVNGTNVLQQALDGCNDNNGVGGVLSACPPFVPYIDSAQANACKPLNDQVNEDVGFGHSISQLPGNNPIWIGEGSKPTYDNYTDDNLTYTDFKSVIPTGYTETGCIAEGTSGRALNGASFSNANMTRGACVSWCQDRGYPLAGIEYGQECYCDFAIRNGASNTTLLSSDKCGMACANNTNENCGGSSTLTLFNNPALYPVSKLPTGWTSNGCMTEGNGQRALNQYSFASSSMTQELCMTTCQTKGYTYAGIEYSSECYCGNSFTSGSVAAASGCSMTCSGNNMQTCGGGSRLTTFKYSNATVAASSSAAASTSTSASASASASSSKASSSTSSAVSTSSAKASASSSSSVVVSSSAAASSSTSKAVSSISSSSSVAKGKSSSVVVSSAAATTTASSKLSSTSKPASSSAKPSTSSIKPSSSSSSIKPSSSSSTIKSTSTVKPSSSSSVVKTTSTAKSSTSSSVAKTTSSSSAAVKTTSTTTNKSTTKLVSSSSSSTVITKSTSSSAAAISSTAPAPAVKIASNQKASSSAAASSSAVASSSASASASSSSAAAAKSSSSSSVVASTSTSSAAASSSISSSVAKSSTSSAAASSSSSSSAAKSSTSSSAAASSTSSAAASSSSTSSSAAVSSTSSAAKSSTSSSVAASSTSASASAASQSAVAGYVGCFKDTSGGRHLSGGYTAGSNMNNKVCTAYCQSKGFAYAGTEYAQECYCGQTLNLALSIAEAKCNTPCRSNSYTNGTVEKCGGGMILSIYSTGLDTGTTINSYPTTNQRRSAKFRL